MDNKNTEMILSISKIDIILAFVTTLILAFFSIDYAIAFFTGNIVATVNFALNGATISRYFTGKKSGLIIQLSFVGRMILILGISLLFRASYVNLVVYIIGFIFHQLAMFIYAQRKLKRR